MRAVATSASLNLKMRLIAQLLFVILIRFRAGPADVAL